MRVVARRALHPMIPPVLAQEVEDGGRLRYVALYGPEVFSDVAVVVLQGAYGEIRREVYGADGRARTGGAQVGALWPLVETVATMQWRWSSRGYLAVAGPAPHLPPSPEAP